MSAKRKPESDDLHTDAPERVTRSGDRTGQGPGVPAEAHAGEAPASPARELQDELHERLEEKMSAGPRQGRVMDLGRILAASSGITMILGVFIFSGIW